MEEALRIFEYLPISYKTKQEEEYINFLWASFESNYNERKYQFAFLAYHMLFMAFVYFNIWQIKKTKHEDFVKSLVGFNNDVEKTLLEATSPFVFHKVNESISFRFLKLIGCQKHEIGNYTKIVQERNDIAHSSGNIFFNDVSTIDNKIIKILSYIDEIQEYSQNMIYSCFEEFLLTSFDPEEREYLDDTDQIREILIHGNYLSQKDVEICSSYDIKILNTHSNHNEIETLFNTFQNEYAENLLSEDKR